jgi:hypothetical protein
MFTCKLLFYLLFQYHLISLENEYKDLHSSTKFKSNLLSWCFITNGIYMLYITRFGISC